MKNKLYLLMLLPLLSTASTVGGLVWLDKNQDWEQSNEAGLANIVVNLFNENNKKIATTKTTKNGRYQFTNIKDQLYTVKVLADGYKSTTPNSIEFWDEKDFTNLDFGLYNTEVYSASGIVWHDEDEDWEQNSKEQGLANITLELYDENSRKVATTKTAKNGSYTFKNIEDKLYTIKVAAKGFNSITPNSLEFWDSKNVTDLNFGLVSKVIIFPPTNQPITRAALETMIKNGEDVTKVNTSKITDMSKLFYNINFNQDISGWDTSNVTNMSRMFQGSFEFNQPIGSWDVSKVTNMSGLFFGANAFNQDISNWNTSNVKNMNSMFRDATNFNQPINAWDVSKVRNMSHMFRGHYVTYVHRLYSTAFNQDLSNWNVSNVETMYEMFHGSNINQDLSNWNVSNVTSWKGIFKKILVRGKPWIKMDEDNKPTKFLDDANSEKAGEKEKFYGNYAKPPVDTNKPITRARLVEMIDNKQDVTKVNTSEITDMSRLFHNNTSFNQNISEWDTSKVTNMKEMFRNAHDFNQPIGKWDVSNVTDMSGMFRGYFYRGRYTKKILNKFNQDLSNWDVSKVTNMRVMFAMSNFVQNISNWDVSNVTNWGYIFSQYLSGPYKNHGKMKKEFMPAKLFNFKGKL